MKRFMKGLISRRIESIYRHRAYLWIVLCVGIAMGLGFRARYLYLSARELRAKRDQAYLEYERLQSICPSLNQANKEAQEAHIALLEQTLKGYCGYCKGYRRKALGCLCAEEQGERRLLDIYAPSMALKASLEAYAIALGPEARLNLDGLAQEPPLRSLEEDALQYLYAAILEARPQSFLGLNTYPGHTELAALEDLGCLGLVYKDNNQLSKDAILLYCRLQFLGYTESLRVLIKLLRDSPYRFILDTVGAKASLARIEKRGEFSEYIPGLVEFTLWIALVRDPQGDRLES